jgi:predicted acyltransferase
VWIHGIFLAGCLAIYIGFMYGYPVPGFLFRGVPVLCGRAVTSEECNFGANLDRAIFGNSSHWMMYPNDPEGWFTTLSSITNTYAGLSFSLLMRWNVKAKGSNMDLLKKWLMVAGCLGVTGALFVIFDPVCKKRWSVSFAFFTSSMSGFALSLCFYVVDILNKSFIKEKLCKPFLWLGMNPLFIFVAMIAFDNLLMDNIKFTIDGHQWNLWGFINEKGFASWMGNEYVASLTVSLLNLALWMGVAYALFRNNIFIKL